VPAGTNHFLESVACPGATYCLAVGTSFNGSDYPLAEAWHGARWVITREPGVLPSALNEELNGVSCVSTTDCLAAGFAMSSFVDSPIVVKWNGRSWAMTVPPMPAGGADGELAGVSCASARSCVAVGEYDTLAGTGTQFLLMDTWNGSKWQARGLPGPAGTVDPALGGVACPSVSLCVAVGTADTATGSVAVAATWRGSRWTLQKLPVPSGTSDPGVGAVACASTTRCFAVGGAAGKGGTALALALSWNGRTWKPMTFRAAAAGKQSLTSISCWSTLGCIAVGGTALTGDGGTMVAYRWTGAAWQPMKLQIPPGGQEFNAQLAGVRCRSAKNCVTVGERYSSTAGDAISEFWNGSSWKFVPVA
jgi:hypothetical protein